MLPPNSGKVFVILWMDEGILSGLTDRHGMGNIIETISPCVNFSRIPVGLKHGNFVLSAKIIKIEELE